MARNGKKDDTTPATDGTATDGTATDGTATDGTATDGTATDGTATDGTATDVVARTGDTAPATGDAAPTGDDAASDDTTAPEDTVDPAAVSAAVRGLPPTMRIYMVALSQPGASTAELAAAAGMDEGEAYEHLSALSAKGGVSGEVVETRWTVVPDVDPFASRTPASRPAATPRPARSTASVGGQTVGDKVRQVLTEQPKQEGYTVGELSEIVGHGSGATGAACDSAAGRGDIELISSSPKRYVLAGA